MRFEIGPIRPPSEAYSLLVRFTRNCPWGKCEFCNLYKVKRFEKRRVQEIEGDIDIIKAIRDDVVSLSWSKGFAGKVTDRLIEHIFSTDTYNDCYRSVALWLYFGGRNVFIQDANSLAMKVDDFARALSHLTETFPTIDRVTSYARSRTIAKRLTVEDLRRLKAAGLSRLHVGLETGYNLLLKYMNKGVTKEEHVECGKKVKEAGIELSEYVILGLGGKKWWQEHALETADALNQINPDFIRFRTFKTLKGMPLQTKIESGEFPLLNDEEIIAEERVLIEKLEGITSCIKSDHIVNLLEEVEGKLPEDKERMLAVIDSYLAMDQEQRLIYRFGRRAGMYRSIADLQDELTYLRIRKTVRDIEEKEPGSVEATLSLLLDNYM